MTKSSKLIQTELKWDESENEEKKAELKKNDSYGVKMSQNELKWVKLNQNVRKWVKWVKIQISQKLVIMSQNKFFRILGSSHKISQNDSKEAKISHNYFFQNFWILSQNQ